MTAQMTDAAAGQQFDMVLDTGNCLVEYYLTQPAATQWVAVGLARPNDGDNCDHGRRLVAGSGPSESDAIRSMLGRCAQG